ncbi:MAG: hypothetical protein AAB250_03100 [Bdellovibrionota bacterium]
MGKVGEKSASETLSQLRDTYTQRERDLESRHKDEIRDISENHQIEISRLRKDSQAKIDSIQEESSTKLNQKDLQFQKEIEAVRSMYSKQVMTSARGKKSEQG